MAPPDDDQLPSRCPFLVLDTDAMSEVFKHVPVKVALRMTCHAAKAGHPECTKGHVADVVGHWASFRLAMDFGLDIQKHGGAIVQQATKGGNLYVLTKAIELGAVWDPMHVLWFAAEHGHLHMLRWLVASHLKEEVVGKGSWYSNILRVAARSGQFKIVQWCIDNNWDICLPETATSAVKSGSLAIVKLLDEKYGNSMDATIRKDMVIHAPRSGNLDMLEWTLGMYANVTGESHKGVLRSMRSTHGDVMVVWAVESGSLEMSKLMYDHFESCLDEGHYDSMVFEAAYAGNNMELFKWTVDLYKTYEGYENESVLGPAASGGNIQMLEWLLERGMSLGDALRDDDVCTNAAASGHFHVLKWARARGGSWSARTCSAAAECGHLEMLQWLRANECHWDAETCKKAASGGHLAVLQWSRANGCDWDQHTLLAAAEHSIKTSEPDFGVANATLDWALAAGAPWRACPYGRCYCGVDTVPNRARVQERMAEREARRH